MSIKLSNFELAMMSAALAREDRRLEPPDGVKAVALIEISAKLVGAGLAREIKARTGAPVWRRDEEAGKSTTLKLTAAGRRAISADANTRIEEEDAAASGEPDAALSSKDSASTTDTPVESNAAASMAEIAATLAALDAHVATAPREGTKIANVLGLLKRNEGATLDEVIAATGWLPHTSRAALTGLRKRGYVIERRPRPEGGSAYAINVVH